MHQHAAGGRAPLPGGPDGAEHDGGNHEFEIGRLVHDDGIVAAQFQQALPQPLGDAHADVTADMRRAGE